MKYRNFYKKIIASILLVVIGFSAIFAVAPLKASAAINKQINYQGKLTNTSNLAVSDGLYNMEFKLYTQVSGGSPIWTETLTTTNRVQVTNGLFSVMLGSTTPFTGVDFNQTLYLGVNIESDGEMSPRKIIGAVPAAFVADTLDNISSEQFLRSDASNSTSTASTFLTILQSGAGKVAEFFGQASASVLALLSNGNVGIGTTTPYAKLSVAGEVVGQNFTATSSIASIFPYASSTALSASGALYVGGTNFQVDSSGNIQRLGGVANTALTATYLNLVAPGGDVLLVNNTATANSNVMIRGGQTSGVIKFEPVSGNEQMRITATGVGIGTTSPYAKLSVVGEVVASHFTGTTTATSTFRGNLAIQGTGTTTSAGGINLSAGCFAINGTCLTTSTYGNTDVNSYIHASSTIPKTYTANVFTGLQRFFNASSTLFSIFDRLYVGGSATTTIQGSSTGTSTFQGYLNVAGTDSKSTFAGALEAAQFNATAGCYAINGTCVVGTGTAGQVAYYEADGNLLKGTSTIRISNSYYGSVGVGTDPTYKLDVLGTARFEGSSSFFDAPSFNSPSPQAGSGAYLSGDAIDYRAYSYKIVNGVRYYSTTYSDSGTINISTNGDVIGITYTLAPGTDGVRTFLNYNGGGFSDYRDGQFTDDGSGWTPGDPSTDAVPAATSTSLLAGYDDGVTKWSAYGNSGAYFGGNVGIGTTSPSAALSINGGFLTTATSTGTKGINLTGGCFAINGTCLSTGGSYGDTNVNSYIHASSTIPKTYTANAFTALQNFINASSSLLSVFNTLYIGGSATTTIQGNTTGTSTIQGFLNVAGTGSTSTFSGNVTVLGTTTASTTLSNLYSDNNRWLKLNELASTRSWNRFTQVNPYVSTTTFHTPTNYYLATSTLNISSSITSNNSGATYNPVNNTIFFINNSNFIYEFTLEGTFLRTITLSGFTDTEALGWMYDDMFVIGDEQGGAITMIRIPNSITTLAKSSGTSITTSGTLGTSNSSIEGVTYDPDRDVFYVTNEGTGTNGGVYQVTRGGAITALFATTTWQTNNIGDASDIYYDRNTEHLFVAVDQCYGQGNGPTSTACDGIIELTLAGQILDKIHAPVGFTQVEGIGFTPDGMNMFISSESDMYAWYKFQERGPLTFNQTSSTTPVNLGIGTTSPLSTLSIKGTNGVDLLTIASSTNSILLNLLQNGNLGIGTTTPYAKLSVVGEVVAASFTATSTTATSTIAGGLSVNILNVSSTTASSTFANGINISTGCFAINNVCVGGNYGDTNVNAYIHASSTIAKTYTANTFTALQNFNTASSSLFSVFNTLYIGGSATTTIQGNTTGTSTIQGFLNVAGTGSTSTFSGALQTSNITTTSTGATSTIAGGLSVNILNVSSTTASSTFANGLNLTGGCFAINGTCLSTGGSYGDTNVNSYIHASSTIPKTYTANAFTALQNFINASSSLLSVFNTLYIGGSATTTIQGNTTGTSTIQGFLNVAGTGSTSTFSGGLLVGNNGGLAVNGAAPAGSLTVHPNGGVRAGTGCNNATVALTVCGSQATVAQFISNSATDAYVLTQVSGGNTLYFGIRSTSQGFLQYPAGGSLRIEASGGSLGTGLLQTLGGGGATSPVASSLSWGTGNLFQVLSTGQTLAPALTASTPSYSFTADTNAGAYSIGDDIIGFATGGAETLRVGTASSSLSRGNFGIGTTSPYAKLSVVGEVVAASFTATTSATSTFGGGINLTGGCFAISGACLAPGGPSVTGTGVTNGMAYWTSSGTIGATTTPTVDAIIATSTTATSTFAGAVKIGSGNLLPTSPFQVGGSIDSYLQANIQNMSAGTSASSDWIATNNLGTDDAYYVDLGINSSTYNNPSYTISGANDAYLYAQSNALAIGTATTSPLGVIKFHTGGTLAANERMRIDVNGNVGIGTTSPWARLSLVSNDSAPKFVIATSSGSIPLFYVDATTTGAMDWARIGIGTSTLGAAGLRDQLVVAGRIYSTWREVRCDSIGASLIVTLTTTDAPSFCGPYAYDVNTDGRLLIPSASPGFGRLEAGLTGTAAINEAAAIRTGLFMAKGENPVFETKTKMTGTFSTSTIIISGFYGSAMATATPAMMPSNGVFFIATTSSNWIAMSRKGDVNEYTNTGIATSTSFQKMRIELSATDATFLINDSIVARHTNTNTLPTVALGPAIVVGVTANSSVVSNARAIDVQYIKSWVDDPAVPLEVSESAIGALNASTPENLIRDLGVEDVVQGGSVAMSYVADKNKVTEEGTIVSLDEGHEFRVRASKGGYDKNIVGVVNSSSIAAYGQEHVDTLRIATQGRVKVRMSLENGPIAIGDYITSSSKSGVGMKATKSGQVVGRALQSFTATSTEETIVVALGITDHVETSNLFAFDEAKQNDITTLAHGMDWVRALRPVSFNFKADGSPSLGFLPEDIKTISPSLVSLDASGNALSVRYELIPVVLAQAIKDLDARVTILENHILNSSSTVAGTINATSTVATVIEAFKGLGTLIENGIASFKSIFADKVSTKELCLDDLCVTRDELQALLDNARVNAHAGTTTPVAPNNDDEKPNTDTSTSTPEVAPSETPDDTVSESEPESTPAPEETPESTPQPESNVAPESSPTGE